MYRTERVFVVTALVATGLAMVVAISRGIVRTGATQLGGVLWALGLTIMAVASVGALWVRASLATSDVDSTLDVRLPLLRLPIEMVIPGLLAAGAVTFVQLFDNAVLQGAVLLLIAAGFAAVYWSELHARDAADRYFALAQSTLNVGSHLTAFLLFSVIFGGKFNSLFSAPAVALVAALLLYELLSRDAAWHRALGLPVEGRQTTIGLLAVVGGLLAGELTWGLNYWAALSTLIGGAFLLVAFYIIHGLASHYVDRNLNRQMIVEYGVVGVVSMAVVFSSAFFS